MVSYLRVMILLFLFAEVGFATAEEAYKKCIKCHGVQGEKSALQKSAVIANYSKEQLVERLKGYKEGTLDRHGYGKLMYGQVKGLTLYEIESIAQYIGKKEKVVEKKRVVYNTHKAEHSSFTGVIEALYNEEEVEFTIKRNSIQILRYDEDGFRGVTAYPNEKRVYIFRKDAENAFYVRVSADKYLNEIIKKYSTYRLSVNTHFTNLTKKFSLNLETDSVSKIKHGCRNFATSVYTKGQGRSIFSVTSCLDLGIPKSWLVYTDLGITNKTDSFPFEVSLSTKEVNLESVSGIVNGFKDFLDIPFTYKMVKVTHKKYRKKTISLWHRFSFKRVNSMEEFKEAFDDTKTPKAPPSNSGSYSGRGHSSWHSIFD